MFPGVKEAQVASEPEALMRWIGDQDGKIAAIGFDNGPPLPLLHRGLSEVMARLIDWITAALML